jgi:hypothetical protein
VAPIGVPPAPIDIGAYEFLSELSLFSLDADKLEGNAGGMSPTMFTFRVSREGKTGIASWAEYRIVPIGEYAVSPADFYDGQLPWGVVTFEPGEIQKDISVPVLGDSIVEHAESFQLQLVRASSESVIVLPTADATIHNDDVATVTISDEIATEGSSLIFNVTLDHGVQGGFLQPWSTVEDMADASDYSTAFGELRFIGLPGETHQVVVRTTHDFIVERDEYFHVRLDAITDIHADLAASVSLDDWAIGSIANDDMATLAVERMKIVEGDVGTTMAAIKVTLGANPIDTMFDVTASTVDGTALATEDYSASVTPLHFSGTAGESKTFLIPIVGDVDVEGNEQFTIELTNLLAGGRESSITLVNTTATILDDDDARIIVNTVAISELDSSTQIVTFDVVLHNPLGGPVSVNIATLDGTAVSGDDFVANAQTLVFSGIDGEVRSFDVAVYGDSVVELDEVFAVELSDLQANGNEAQYTLVNGGGTIKNDDAATLSFFVDAPCADPQVLLCQAEGDGDFVVKIQLIGNVDIGFSVKVSTHGETATSRDFVASEQVLAFSGNDGQVVTFSIPALDDNLREGNSLTFGIQLSDLLAEGREIRLGAAGTLRIDDDEFVPGSPGFSSPPPLPSPVPELCDGGSTGQGGTNSGGSNGTLSDFQPVQIGALLFRMDGSFYRWWVDEYPEELMLTVVPVFTEIPGRSTGISSGTTDEDRTPCATDDGSPLIPPPAPDPIHVDWTVPHTGSLTFNPFPTFNYRLAQDIGVTINNGNNAFARIGETVNLEFGTVTVNADMTLTYDPYDDLMARGTLRPELDANGNVFRFTGIEDFEAHIVDFAVVEPLGVPLGEGSGPPSLPITYASVPVQLAVSNHLPTLRGDRIHSPDPTSNAFWLDSPIFLDLDTTLRVDLTELFVDLDGDTDLGNLKVKDINYGGQKLDMSNSNASPPVVDRYPNQIRVPIATTTSGATVTDPATGNTIVQFGGAPNEPSLIAMPAGPAIDFHNTIWPGQIAQLNNVNYPSSLFFTVTVTDGTKIEVTDTATGTVTLEEVTWDVMIEVRPNPDTYTSSIAWRRETAAPEVDYRPWVIEVTPKLDPLADDSISRDSVGKSVKSSQLSVYGFNSEHVGGVDVDLNAGQFRRYHSLILDGSGGTSELAIGGLIYESATVRPEPIVRLQADDNGTAGSVTLHTVSGVAETGVYGWQTSVNVSGTTLKVAGETAVVASSNSPTFGAGWSLQGVPSITIDLRDESDSSAARRTYDDRIVLVFPGELPKVFNASDLVFNDYSYASPPEGLHSLQPGSTEIGHDGFANPQEFGKLISRKPTDAAGNVIDELVYDDGTGMEYVFKKHVRDNGTPSDPSDDTITYLIDRIEQPGIDINPTTRDWNPGRRGLSFEWDDATYGWPVLTVIEATDGARTLLDYTLGNGYLGSMTLVDGTNAPLVDPATGGPARQVFFTIENRTDDGIATQELVQIRHDNGMDDPVRIFDYENGKLTVDQWYDDDPTDPAKLARHTEFAYTDGRLSQLQLGDGIGTAQNTITYQIDSAADDLAASVSIDVPDLAKYDEATETVITTGGVYETFYKYSLDGLLERRAETFNGVELSRESWDYDHIGFAKRYTDPIGRQTFYWRDYETPVGYENNQDDPNDLNADTEPKYDHNDYRGNITYLFTPAGQTIFEYETDDETLNALGRLVKTIDKPKISATGQPAAGGTVAQVVTIYDYQADGRMTRRQAIRGSQDPVDLPDSTVTSKDSEANNTTLHPKPDLGKDDAIELWTYGADNFLASYTSPSKLMTQYDYDPMHRLDWIQIQDDGPDGIAGTSDDETRTTELFFDALGFVDEEFDYFGSGGANLLAYRNYDYDRRGLLQKIETKDGNAVLVARDLFEYAPDGVVVAIGNGNDVYTTFTYDKAGLLTQEIVGLVKDTSGDFVPAEYYSLYANASVPISESTTYEYYDDGSLKTATLPGGIHRSNYADPAARKYWSSIDGVSASPLSDATQVIRTETDVFGRVTLQENLLLGTSSEYLYEDPRIDLPTSTVEHVNLGELDSGDNYIIADVWAKYQYDSNGNILYEVADGTAAYATKYDELGYAVETSVKPTNNVGPGAFVTHSFVTNPVGAVVQQTEFRKTLADASWNTEPFVTTYRYDEQSRLREVIDPLTDGNGSCTAKPATPQTDECNAKPAITNFEFDAGNLKVTSKSRTGATSIQWLNGIGQLVKERSPWGTSETDLTKAVTTYEYDLAGNLTKQKYTPATNETAIQATKTEIKYDALNRPRVTIAHGVQSAFSAVDYFATGDGNGDGWNVVSFVPFEGTDPAALSVANIKDFAAKTKFDSLGKPILVESPAPGDVDHDNDPNTPSIPADHGTSQTSIKYVYEPTWLTYTVITEQADAKQAGTVTGDLTTVNTYNTRDQLIQAIATKVEPANAAPGSITPRVIQQNEYYPTGQLKLSTDGEENATKYLEINQVVGLPTKIQRGDAAGLYLQRITDYEYDSAGNVTKENPPGASNPPTSRTYDALGRIKLERASVDQLSFAPSAGTVVLDRKWFYQGDTVVYKNRNDEHVVTTTDLATKTSTENWFGISGTVPSSSATPIEVITTSFSSDGRVTDVGAISYEYSDRGQLVFESYDIPSGLSIDVGALYSPSGRVQSSILFDGLLVQRNTIGLDNLGRVATQLQDSLSGVAGKWINGSVAADKLLHFRYNADNSLQGLDRYQGTAIDTTKERGFTHYGYDAEARLADLTHLQNTLAKSIASYGLQYDNAAKLERRLEQFYDSAGATPAMVKDAVRFKYDSSGRLTEVGIEDPADPMNVNWNPERNLDDAGNQDSSSNQILLPNRLVQDASYNYTFDKEGRVVERSARAGGTTYLVDNESGVSIQLSDGTVGTAGWTLEDGVSPSGNAQQRVSIVGPTQGGGSQWALATVDLSYGGNYDVWIVWKPLANGGKADVEITLGSSTIPLIVDEIDYQQSPSGVVLGDGLVWQKLGTVYASGASDLNIRLTQQDPNGGPIAFDAIRVVPSVVSTTYEWDHRGRLQKETQFKDGNADGGKIIIDYVYDALNRLVARHETVEDRYGNGTTTSKGFVYDGQQLLFEVDGNNKITRSWLRSAADGQVVAVDEAIGSATTLTVWMFADMAGTVRSLATVDSEGDWHVLHRKFTEDGQPTILSEDAAGETEHTLLANAPLIWKGMTYDAASGLYLTSVGAYDPASGRSLIDRGGENGYILFGGAPTTNSASNHAEPTLWGAFTDSFAYYVNPANNWNDGNKLLGGAQYAGWAAIAVSTAGLGIVAGGTAAGGGALGYSAYVGSQVGISVFETAVEGGLASAMGGDFNAGATFGKNLVVNLATGGIGNKLKWGGKAGAYLARQGIEVAGDTAIDVGVYGRSFGSSLAMNTVGSVGGELAFKGIGRGLGLARGALTSGRRTAGNYQLPVINDGCFTIDTATHGDPIGGQDYREATGIWLITGLAVAAGFFVADARRRKRGDKAAIDACHAGPDTVADEAKTFDIPPFADDKVTLMEFEQLCDRLFNDDENFWSAAEPSSYGPKVHNTPVQGRAKRHLPRSAALDTGTPRHQSPGGAIQTTVVLDQRPSLPRTSSRVSPQPAPANLGMSVLRKLGLLVLLVTLLGTVFGLWKAHELDHNTIVAIQHREIGQRAFVDAPKEALATDFARLSGVDADWNASTGDLEIAGVVDPLRQLTTEPSTADLAEADYRKIILRAQDIWPDGTVNDINVETFQPWQWIHEHEVHVGGEASLPLDVEEMGIASDIRGKVIDILPAKFKPGRGRIILTTVNQLNRDVWELTLEDESGVRETLRPTGTHLFYSVSQGDWAPASKLQPGETLNGIKGPVKLIAARQLSGTHRVYNFTVQGEHLYRVANSGVLVHNNYAPNSTAGKFDVGPYNQMKGKVPGLDAHHAGQSAAMKKVIKNYDHDTAPTILVPKVGHTIKGPNGIVSRSTKGLDNARDILARDIKELRRVYPNVPNSKLKELIEMNKNLYPEMLK